jgi:hypothetical protein
MTWTTQSILAIRLLGYIRICQLVLKNQITWPKPVSPRAAVTVGEQDSSTRGGRVMVVLAIVFVTFFGAGITFGLNFIYSRSVRRVRKPRASVAKDQVNEDSWPDAWSSRY